MVNAHGGEQREQIQDAHESVAVEVGRGRHRRVVEPDVNRAVLGVEKRRADPEHQIVQPIPVKIADTQGSPGPGVPASGSLPVPRWGLVRMGAGILV